MTNREKITAIATPCDTTLKNIKWRVENRYWLKHSQYVALLLLAWMDTNSISKENMATMLNIAKSELDIWVKGSYDFKLSEVAKIEYITGEVIINNNFASNAYYAEKYEKHSIDFTKQAEIGKQIAIKAKNA